MTVVADIIATNPASVALPTDQLAACIASCVECASVCETCADACLAEDMVAELRDCIRLDLACRALCAATAQVLNHAAGLPAEVIESTIAACAQACAACAEECERHADMHEHCRLCAEACRRCEQACRQLAKA